MLSLDDQSDGVAIAVRFNLDNDFDDFQWVQDKSTL
jgi:hypothetical protein